MWIKVLRKLTERNGLGHRMNRIFTRMWPSWARPPSAKTRWTACCPPPRTTQFGRRTTLPTSPLGRPIAAIASCCALRRTPRTRRTNSRRVPAWPTILRIRCVERRPTARARQSPVIHRRQPAGVRGWRWRWTGNCRRPAWSPHRPSTTPLMPITKKRISKPAPTLYSFYGLFLFIMGFSCVNEEIANVSNPSH